MKKLKITIGEQSYEVTVERLDVEEDAPSVRPAGPRSSDVAAPVKRAAPAARPKLSSGEITSPMAGVVLSVGVKEGEEIDQDRLLVVLEAMKMENQIISPSPATVKKIHVKAGESVQEGQLLVELE